MNNNTFLISVRYFWTGHHPTVIKDPQYLCTNNNGVKGNGDALLHYIFIKRYILTIFHFKTYFEVVSMIICQV